MKKALASVALPIYAPNETRSRILALRHLVCARSVAGASTIRQVR